MKPGGRHTPLTQACVQGDQSHARALLEDGADIEERGRNGGTPLIWAAMSGRAAVITLLVERGARLDTMVGDRAALMAAAEAGHAGVVELLIAAGARDDVEDSAGRTAITLARTADRASVVEYLLDRGTPLGSGFVGTQDQLREWAREQKKRYEQPARVLEPWERHTPLTQACVDGDLERARALLDDRAEIEEGGRFAETPLIWTAISGQEAVVALLIERGARLDTMVNNRTALMAAARAGHLGTVELLHAAGARADLENEGGLAATAVAWFAHKISVVEYLLDRGAALGSEFQGTPAQLREWVREVKERSGRR